MKTTILYRVDRDNQEEYDIAAKTTISKLVHYRSQITEDSLVIGRYSVLPFYKELEEELALKNSRLINSYEQHLYIADIMNWYEDIKEYTPETYTTWGHIKDGQWVVKGRTNSRKFNWNTMMFADGREDLIEKIKMNMVDPLIREQGIVVRKYVPLKKVDEGINGLPISKEWRLFFLGKKLISLGYYWSSHMETAPKELPTDGIILAKKVAAIIAKKTNFFVIDIAEKEDGGYIVVEINDGQMSGLSTINPTQFYTRLDDLLL